MRHLVAGMTSGKTTGLTRQIPAYTYGASIVIGLLLMGTMKSRPTYLYIIMSGLGDSKA